MGKPQPLTVCSHILLQPAGDEKQAIDFTALTPQQLQAAKQIWAKRVSLAASGCCKSLFSSQP